MERVRVASGFGGSFREIARHQTSALYEDRIALKLRCSRAMAMVQPWHVRSVHGGTVSSNPLCSSGESAANLTPSIKLSLGQDAPPPCAGLV